MGKFFDILIFRKNKSTVIAEESEDGMIDILSSIREGGTVNADGINIKADEIDGIAVYSEEYKEEKEN